MPRGVPFGGTGRHGSDIAWDEEGELQSKPSYLPATEYAWKYEGVIYIPETRTYTFALASDDGADLSIHGEKVITRYSTACDVGANGVCTSGSIKLSEGFHNITVRMEEVYGGDGVSLYSSGVVHTFVAAQ